MACDRFQERKGEIWPNSKLDNGYCHGYSALFSIGEIIFGVWSKLILRIIITAASGTVLFWNLNRIGWAGFAGPAEPKGVEAIGD